MSGSLVPVKTAAGQQELAERTRRLGQRHRTLLLLVDGRRTLAQVLQMAQAAGVPPQLHDELVAMGLVALPQVGAGSESQAPDSVLHIDLPLHDEAAPASESPAALAGPLIQRDSAPERDFQPDAQPGADSVSSTLGDSGLDTSLLPAAQPLMAESSLLSGLQVELPDGATAADSDSGFSASPALDAQAAQARDMLARLLRNEAPVSGALTLRRVKRAASREELLALLDEVSHRVRKPRRRLVVEHSLRQVRHLLGEGEAQSALPEIE